LEDEEIQKRGIVVIHFLMKHYDQGTVYKKDIVDRRTVYRIGVLVATIPVRVEAMHVCCTELHTVLATKILLYTTGEALRVRTRWHLGTKNEMFLKMGWIFLFWSHGSCHVPATPIRSLVMIIVVFLVFCFFLVGGGPFLTRWSPSLLTGSFLEVIYAIAPFGIPWHIFPIHDDGGFDMKPHEYWMERRRQLDQQYEYDQQNRWCGEATRGISPDNTSIASDDDRTNSTCSVELHSPEQLHQQQQRQGNNPGRTPSPAIGEPVIPRPQDVLLGGLKVTQTQSGNALFRKLVEKYQDQYERCATKLQKMKITKKIISEIKSVGGARFLKQTNFKYGKDGRVIKKTETRSIGGDVTVPRKTPTTIQWVEIPDHVARDRISHAFRNLRAKNSLQRNTAATAGASLAANAPFMPIAMTMNATNISYNTMNYYSDGGGGVDGACWNLSPGSHGSDTFGCFGGGT
jgi:hypothetical protein